MARVKITMPEIFSFSTPISLRISDLNYGGHVGNDTVLSLFHEARVRFLRHCGYGELDVEGHGLIMSDAAIEYRAELFYGDETLIHLAATDFSRVGFDLVYLLEKRTEQGKVIAARGKTGMIYYDYQQKKVLGLPETVKNKLLRG